MTEIEKKRQEVFLNAIFQNTKTALQSIADILPKVKNKELEEELKVQYEKYDEIANKCRQYAEKYQLNMKDNNFFEKAKLWTSIKLTTLTDNSTRHLAEMLLFGTNMGIITCYKDRYDHLGASEELDILAQQLENIEIGNFDNLKPFLNKDQKR